MTRRPAGAPAAGPAPVPGMAPPPAIALVAGGTGGHLFPALAVSGALQRRGCPVLLVTDERGGRRLEAGQGLVLPAGRTDRGWRGRLAGPGRLIGAAIRAHRAFRRHRIALVVGFGGYPSVAPLIAARLAGRPSLLHEQNALLGRANRFAARRARMIALSFAATGRVPGGATTRLVGNPVRGDLAGWRGVPYAPPRPDDPVRILVLGGSQGAARFAGLIPRALGGLAARDRLRVEHQSRPEDLDKTRAAYATVAVRARVASFFDDIGTRLGKAHLVICRAGASTIAEMAVVGRPAILIPYPHAADDHQTANAQAVADDGGGWLLPQPDLTPDRLRDRVAALLGDPGSLTRAAAAARRRGRPDAADRLADLAIGLATGGAAGP